MDDVETQFREQERAIMAAHEEECKARAGMWRAIAEGITALVKMAVDETKAKSDKRGRVY